MRACPHRRSGRKVGAGYRSGQANNVGLQKHYLQVTGAKGYWTDRVRQKYLSDGGNIAKLNDMKIKYETWTKSLTSFCESHSFDFEIQQHAPVGYGGQIVSFRAHIKNAVKDYIIIQSGQKANDVIGLNHLYANDEKYTGKSLKISIREHEFFDRLFCRKRILTGDALFDEKFVVKANEPDLAMHIFRDTEISSFFMANRFIVFNIHPEGSKSIITLKDMRNIIFSPEDLTQFINTFSLILRHVYEFAE